MDRDIATMGRRNFIVASGVLAAAAVLPDGPAWSQGQPPAAGSGAGSPKGASAANQAPGEFTLPPLPYPPNGLEPHISANTLGFHHGKHHQAYVTQTNALKKGSPFEAMDLVSIVKGTAGKDEFKPLFNNAAQVWNHTFYWHCMKPGGSKPSAKLAAKIDAAFGSQAKLIEQLTEAGVSQFGSGWAWLAADSSGTLKIVKTANADNPLTQGLTPLLTVDVWEHAYYLDYQNRRKDHVQAVLTNLANWEFASANLDGA